MPNVLPFESAQNYYIGIDPGVKGGLAVLNNESKSSISFSGKNAYDIRNIIEYHKATAFGKKQNLYILLEEVSGFIGGEVDGKKRNVASAHTTFTLGEHFGMLQMALVCSRLSFRMIRPQEWRKRLGLEGKTKNELKTRAKELFPEEKITLSTCDAFLLAYLCRSLNK
jgi:hypothetical protein